MFKKKSEQNDLLADRVSHEEFVSKRNKKPKTMAWILTFMLVLIVGMVLIGIYLCFTHPYFNIDRVAILGNRGITDEQIVEAIGIGSTTNVFKVNTSELEAKISQIEAIKSVDVKKVLPDELKITVSEEFDLGYIDVGDGYLVVGGDLKVKRHVPNLEGLSKMGFIKISNAAYVTLAVDNPVSDDKNEIRFLKSLIDKELLNVTKEVDFGKDEEGIKMKVNNDTIIDFGKPDDVDYKFSVIEKIIVDLKEKGVRAKEIILRDGIHPIVITD